MILLFSWLDKCHFTPFFSIYLTSAALKPPFKRGLTWYLQMRNGLNTLGRLACYVFKAANILGFLTLLDWIWIVWLYSYRLHLSGIISSTGSSELIQYTMYIWGNPWLVSLYHFYSSGPLACSNHCTVLGPEIVLT